MVSGAELQLLTEIKENEKAWVIQQLWSRGFKAEFVEIETFAWLRVLGLKTRKKIILRIL